MAKTVKSAAKVGKAKKTAPAKGVVAKAVRKPAPKAAGKGRALVASPPAVSPVVEDYLAIQQLLHKYCHVVDRGTADEVAELFHPDGVLCPRYESDDRYEGREAVRGWYARYMENFRTKVRYLRHKIASPVIDITGDEATSVCYLDADSVALSSDRPSIAFGRYEDKLVKEGGRWWFKERTIIVYYSYSIESYREGRGV